MNYTQIQQFLVFSKTLNMTKAAKELYISQPALSHSISRMEDELGLKLIYRDGNRLIMTEAGQELLKDFEAIEKVYDSMYAHAQMMREERTKKLFWDLRVPLRLFRLCSIMAFYHLIKAFKFRRFLRSIGLSIRCC
ncbi:MAG: LysR family transcriptional regulator [Lachnospiraceae bacterium]|nr:LysR family transcriptional regulator [Lachnospiraceae bacterium]